MTYKQDVMDMLDEQTDMGERVKKIYTWEVEFKANGMYQAGGKLTDTQINAITDMIISFDEKNSSKYGQ